MTRRDGLAELIGVHRRRLIPAKFQAMLLHRSELFDACSPRLSERISNLHRLDHPLNSPLTKWGGRDSLGVDQQVGIATMAMGRQGGRQGQMMVLWDELPKSPGHVFYDRLQRPVLLEAGFDAPNLGSGIEREAAKLAKVR